jgi:aspartyl-tRNA(Asn)/glutamyl-tRNA(Gln) amidotransferase subunit A
MSSLADLTCSELLEAFASRQASPVDAVKACFERIEAVDSQINAVLTRCADEALAAATEAEKRWADSAARPLEGVPFGLKDIVATAGVVTTGGGKVYAGYVPDSDATVAARLRAAGGILLAKLHSWEFAGSGIPLGQTRNPWNTNHMAGGSSSGSAAAISACEMPLAIGTDTGGSLRGPTAFCGITSIKPTFGRVSRFGVMPLSWTLDHVGPMGRSVEDVARCLEVIAGHDSRDPSSGTVAVPRFSQVLNRDLTGIRIGIPANWFFELCDAEIRDATIAAAEVLEAAGATLQEVTIGVLEQINPGALLWLITNPEAASLHEINSDRLDLYSAESISRILDGRMIMAVDYIRALRLRHLLQRGFEEAFDAVDALITPGAIAVAPQIEREDSIIEAWATVGEERYPWLDVIGRATSVFNLVGIPALTLPSGVHSSGLPMAIQISAPPYEEEICLQLGYAYQLETTHHKRRPPLLEVLAHPQDARVTRSGGEPAE